MTQTHTMTVPAEDVCIGDRIISDPFGNPVRLRVQTIHSKDVTHFDGKPRTLFTFGGHDSAPNYSPGPRTLYYGATDQLRIEREDS